MGAEELNNVYRKDEQRTNNEWLYSGSTTNKRRTKDEEKTNK
ncbi:hypothetical protein HMPREF1528_01173 [Capnocytophaga sp. oral taxon 336 str. F0502]|nr:hypothetical protein HMPREF1528_01173 [Capnocytophaga sp. oral taxon 336 str. F0502]